MDMFKDLTEKIEAAKRDIKSAKNGVSIDKQQRAGSFFARVVDFLTTTPAETALVDAKTRLSVTISEAREAAGKRIVEVANKRFNECLADVQRHGKSRKTIAVLQEKQAPIGKWLRLARTAERHLCSAVSKCSEASTGELLDFVSSSKAISAFSALETSEAGSAVSRARASLEALSKALPKRVDGVPMITPDGDIDYFIDMVFNFGFDFFSLLDMDQLDEAEEQCGKALLQLEPLLQKLQTLFDDLQLRIDKEMQLLISIETPHIAAIAATVPGVLSPEEQRDEPVFS